MLHEWSFGSDVLPFFGHGKSPSAVCSHHFTFEQRAWLLLCWPREKERHICWISRRRHPASCLWFFECFWKLRKSWVDLGLLHSVFSCCVDFDSPLEEFPPSQERSWASDVSERFAQMCPWRKCVPQPILFAWEFLVGMNQDEKGRKRCKDYSILLKAIRVCLCLKMWEACPWPLSWKSQQ